MYKGKRARGLLTGVVLLGLVGLLITGCDSSSTSGGGSPDSDSQYVATEESAGRITMRVRRNPLPVGATSSFMVNVVDSAGAPVPEMRISCDSEAELAIVEPNHGYAMTDAWGNMSGVVGCRARGSFQLVCRLPLGANKRVFETVVCTGEPPEGFTGWPEAAGGGLGGGVDTTGTDSAGEFGLRVSNVEFADGGNDPTRSIDIVQGICDRNADPIIVEPFTDAVVRFAVVNKSEEVVRFVGFSYVVENFDGTGANHISPQISFIGEAPAVSAGGTGTFTSLFMEANNGGKRYFGRADNILEGGGDRGFKNVRFNITARRASGEAVTIGARTAISVDNFNNCR